MPLHRNIKRVDDDVKRQHRWEVAVQRKGERVYRSFSDGVHGGKEESLAAAIAYRDYVLSRCSDAEHKIWLRTRPNKNNTSGIIGVSRYKILIKPKTKRHDIFWEAFWTDGKGCRGGRRFSISRYGESQAKKLAIAERDRQMLRVRELHEAYAGNPEALASHMLPEQEAARKKQLVFAAKALLSLQVSISMGCMRISKALHGLDYQDEPQYQIFKQIKEAMRGFPIGEKRFLSLPSELLEQDKKLARIEGKFRPEILMACIAIIEQYKS